jgi:hypothetical protein
MLRTENEGTDRTALRGLRDYEAPRSATSEVQEAAHEVYDRTKFDEFEHRRFHISSTLYVCNHLYSPGVGTNTSTKRGYNRGSLPTDRSERRCSTSSGVAGSALRRCRGVPDDRCQSGSGADADGRGYSGATLSFGPWRF